MSIRTATDSICVCTCDSSDQRPSVAGASSTTGCSNDSDIKALWKKRCHFCASQLPLLVLFSINIVYIIVGGSIFHAFESPYQQSLQNSSVMVTLLEGLTYHEVQCLQYNWDYSSSVFFATTVVTTIGK